MRAGRKSKSKLTVAVSSRHNQWHISVPMKAGWNFIRQTPYDDSRESRQRRNNIKDS